MILYMLKSLVSAVTMNVKKLFVCRLFLRLVSPEASKYCDFADDIKMKRFSFHFNLTFFSFVLLKRLLNLYNREKHFKLPLLFGHFSYFNFLCPTSAWKWSDMSYSRPLFTPLYLLNALVNFNKEIFWKYILLGLRHIIF